MKTSLCQGKRKLHFATPQISKKKRDIFEELPSSSDSGDEDQGKFIFVHHLVSDLVLDY